jgi:hypothetical protein
VEGVAAPPGWTPPDLIRALPGQSANRLLVHSAYGIQLVDSDGETLASASGAKREPQPYWPPMTLTDFGYLTALGRSDAGEDAALYDPFDLRLLATARMDGPPPGPQSAYDYYLATQTAEGAIVVAQLASWPDGIERTRLSWFAVPGTPSAERLMRDGFED